MAGPPDDPFAILKSEPSEDPYAIVKAEPTATGPADLNAPMSPGERAFQAWAQTANPFQFLNAVLHPIDTLGVGVHQMMYHAGKARELYDQGRYSEAAGHLGAAGLPYIGPVAADAAEKIAAGDVAGGAGQTAGLFTNVFTPRLAMAGYQLAGDVAPVEAVRTAVGTKLGIDPTRVEALDLAAARMRLEAARSRTRQTQMRQDLAEAAAKAQAQQDLWRTVGHTKAVPLETQLAQAIQSLEPTQRAEQTGGEPAKLDWPARDPRQLGELVAQQRDRYGNTVVRSAADLAAEREATIAAFNRPGLTVKAREAAATAGLSAEQKAAARQAIEGLTRQGVPLGEAVRRIVNNFVQSAQGQPVTPSQLRDLMAAIQGKP